MSSLPLGSNGRQCRPVLSCEPEPLTVRVVLRDVEVDRPRPQRVASSSSGRRRARCWSDQSNPSGRMRSSGRVVAHREEQRVRHVGLEADGLRPVHHLEQLDVALHAVHAAPADFPFGRQPLAVTLGDVGRLAERVGDLLRVAGGILRPLRRTRRRVDADDAVAADAEVFAASARSRTPCAPASGTPCAPRRCPSRIRRRSAATPARRAIRPSGSSRGSCRRAASGRRRSSRC